MPLSDVKILSYESFILFNNLASRFKDTKSIHLSEKDILYRGTEILQITEEIIYQISKKPDLKYQSLNNTVVKLQKMLEMSHPQDIAMTKFFNRIKSTHRYISSIGEKFVSLNIFLGVFPDHKPEDLIEIKTAKVVLDDEIDVDSF